ncbi:MAG TPA: TIGR02266 family protein [Polyangia bacterium]
MRTPITLKIKFKSASLDQFIERYSVDVSRGGIFIRTKEPLAVGTQLKFEFQLQDASSLIAGEGTVVWIREHDPNRSGVAPGMGVRFDKLQPQSQQILDKILAEKSKRGEAQMESRFDAGVRASATASGIVSSASASAPRSPHNDFGGGDSKTHTPLPAPVPGLDAGDEFTDESTRVMQDSVVQKLAAETRGEADNPFAESEPTRKANVEQLEKLAKTAGPGGKDEKAPAKVEASVEVKPEAKVEAKPEPKIETKPEPKIEAKPEPKIETKPEPKVEAKPEAKVEAKPEAKVEAKPEAKLEKSEAKQPPKSDAKPAAKAPAKDLPKDDARPVAAASAPPQKRSSVMPALLVIAAVAAAGVYYAFSSGSTPDNAPAPVVAERATNAPMRRLALKPGALQLAADRAAAVMHENNAGPAPGEPTAAPATPTPAPVVAAQPAGLSVPVTSDPPGATVTVDGKPLAQPTPTALAGLDAKKVYQVQVALKGFHSWKVKLKPKSGDKLDAALVPNEKVVTVTSTPAGAALLVDGKVVGRTPYTLRKLDLSRTHALELKRSGYVTQTRTVSASDAFETRGDRDVLALALKLEAAPRPQVARVRHPVKKPVEKPAAAEAATEKPAAVADTSAAEKPAADKPAEVEKPAADKPASTEQAASDKPVATPDKPAADKPASEKPAAATKPAADKPAAKPGATDKPAIKVPSWMKSKPADPATATPPPENLK